MQWEDIVRSTKKAPLGILRNHVLHSFPCARDSDPRRGGHLNEGRVRRLTVPGRGPPRPDWQCTLGRAPSHPWWGPSQFAEAAEAAGDLALAAAVPGSHFRCRRRSM